MGDYHQKIPHQNQVKLSASLANRTAIAGTNRSNLLEIARTPIKISAAGLLPPNFAFRLWGRERRSIGSIAALTALVQLAAGAVAWVRYPKNTARTSHFQKLKTPSSAFLSGEELA